MEPGNPGVKILEFRPKSTLTGKPRGMSKRELERRAMNLGPEVKSLHKQIEQLQREAFSLAGAHRLKCFRQFLGYKTASEFARYVNIPPQRYLRYERRFPIYAARSVIFVRKLGPTGVSLDWLLFGTGEPVAQGASGGGVAS